MNIFNKLRGIVEVDTKSQKKDDKDSISGLPKTSANVPMPECKPPKPEMSKNTIIRE